MACSDASVQGVMSVFLYIPNIIGYSRVLLAVLSFALMAREPWVAIWLYGLSCIMDALDGHAARLECAILVGSKFGAVLDMVTDRCTTAGLLCYLGTVYPDYVLVFQILIYLDISSHYMHMYSSLSAGSSSHKSIPRTANPILYLYYTSQKVLFLVCMFNELFFVLLLARSIPSGPFSSTFLGLSLLDLLLVVSFPVCAFKQWVNVIQMINAARSLAAADSKRSK